MTIPELAQHRARCAAELETLSQVTLAGDNEENAAHLKALALAKGAYRAAEMEWAAAMQANKLAVRGL